MKRHKNNIKRGQQFVASCDSEESAKYIIGMEIALKKIANFKYCPNKGHTYKNLKRIAEQALKKAEQ